MNKMMLWLSIAIIPMFIGTILPGNDHQQTDPKRTTVIGTNIGNKAPEIKLKNPEGKEILLSSLKGKLVLIDFWASWCRPCRAENPNVVAAYQRYKDSKFKSGNGFTIYSVSLDNNKAAWEKAIKDDKLEWTYHVSDLKGWNNAAASAYGVNGIPTNFLIDENGIIIAKSLHGDMLEMTLQNQVKYN